MSRLAFTTAVALALVTLASAAPVQQVSVVKLPHTARQGLQGILTAVLTFLDQLGRIADPDTREDVCGTATPLCTGGIAACGVISGDVCDDISEACGTLINLCAAP